MSNAHVSGKDDDGVPVWTLGWRLRRALAHGKVGVTEMADHLGYSRGQISRYLKDDGEPPRRPILIAWALRTGVPLEWILTGTVTQPGPNEPHTMPGKNSPWSPDDLPVRPLHIVTQPVPLVAESDAA